MIVFSYLHLLCAETYIFLAFFVFFRDRKAPRLLFALPIFLFIGQWTGINLFTDHIRETYCWCCVWKRSVWTFLFFAYLFSNLCYSFYLLMAFNRKTNNVLIKLFCFEFRRLKCLRPPTSPVSCF